jgi:hypothetical protein
VVPIWYTNWYQKPGRPYVGSFSRLPGPADKR